MSFGSVAIIGLGLLGGSVGLAVSEHLPALRTTGYDADPATRARAAERGLEQGCFAQHRQEWLGLGCAASWPQPRAAAAIVEIKVAGGHRSISQPGVGWAAINADTSASDAAVPFIFQLPAASLRMMPSCLCHQR